MSSIKSVVEQVRRAEGVEKKVSIIEQFKSKKLRNYLIVALGLDGYPMPDVSSVLDGRGDLPVDRVFRDAEYFFYGVNRDAVASSMERISSRMSAADCDFLREALGRPDLGLRASDLADVWPEFRSAEEAEVVAETSPPKTDESTPPPPQEAVERRGEEDSKPLAEDDASPQSTTPSASTKAAKIRKKRDGA